MLIDHSQLAVRVLERTCSANRAKSAIKYEPVGEKMKKTLSIVLIAVLAFGIGIAYAAPMLIIPVNIQPLPQVVRGA